MSKKSERSSEFSVPVPLYSELRPLCQTPHISIEERHHLWMDPRTLCITRHPNWHCYIIPHYSSPPDQDHQFELEVDASQFAIDAILWQRDPANQKKLRACGYYSATLSLAERNYKVFNRELLGIIHTLQHWSHLLHGTVLPILIWTDYRNLTY